VHEGQKVAKGQLLISLDDSEARTQVSAALAAVRGAEAQLEALRHGGTRQEQITMTSNIDKARAAREQQAANLATLEKLQQQGAASTSEVDAARRALAADDAGLQSLGQQQRQIYRMRRRPMSRHSTPCRKQMCALPSPERFTPSPFEAATLFPVAFSCCRWQT
jgi:HlyD family secretion protein